MLVPKSLFDETKLVVIRLPSAHRNEEFSKHFISKLKSFKNDKVRFNITWNTCKIKSLFNNKDKVEHFSCIIQKGVCSCGADYIGEKIHNVNIRWNDYKSWINKNSECTRHLQEHFNLEFQWSLLSLAPRNTFKQKIFEVYFVKTMEPSQNIQMNSDVLTHFINGII